MNFCYYLERIRPLIGLISFFFTWYCNYTLYNLPELSKTYYKYFHYTFLFFFINCLISSFQVYFTQPGFITEKTNETMLILYKISRKIARERSIIYNNEHKNENNKINNHSDYEDDSSDNEIEETYKFNKSKYQENLFNQCKENKEELGFNVYLCNKCYSIKVKGVHHCNECHKCVYNRDHHCGWFNNCIGQFNQKFFLLFILYLFIFSILSLFISFFYFIFIRFTDIFEFGFKFFLQVFFHICLNVIYIILAYNFILDQYETIKEKSIVYDYHNNCMIEIRSKYETLCEIFGEEFSINWFLPFTKGGFYPILKRKVKYSISKND